MSIPCTGSLISPPPSAPADGASGNGTRRISGAASGVSPCKELRVLRVALEIPKEEVWIELRKLAFHCAAFGNALLSENYIGAKQKEVKFTTYTDFADRLSAGIRDAVSRECIGLWRRLGKEILSGRQTLARFTSDRALVIRDRAVRLKREEDRIVAHLRLHPQNEGDVTSLPLWMGKADPWYRSLLDKLVDGELRIAKATLVFERPGRKVFLLLAYEQPVVHVEAPPTHRARIGIDDEQLWLRDDEGHRKSLTNYLHRLAQRKTDFASLHRRLRMSLGRRRRAGYRQELRQALARAGSYEDWARGPLHEMSREIVEWCVAQKVSKLDWELPTEGLLPWARLREMATYKAREQGIEISQMRPAIVQKRVLRKMRSGNSQKDLANQGTSQRIQ